jgi:hypothetical protein
MSDTQLTFAMSVDITRVETAIGEAKASFESMSVSIEETKTHFAAAQNAAESWSSRLIHGAGEGLGKIKEVAHGAAELAATAIGAGEKVYEFAESIGKTAEQNQQLAISLGLTTREVQQLHGLSAQTGVSVNALAKGLGQMGNGALAASGHSKTVAAALKAVGVSANDGRSSMDRLVAVADKFKQMPDGPQKTALAMKLFGDVGKELVPVLNQGSQALAAMNAKTAEYGAVSDSAQQKGLALADAVGESKLAWQGLQTILTDAFAPVLKEVIDGFDSLVKWLAQSYESGGAMKTVFDSVTTVFHGVWEIILSVGDALSFFFTSTSKGGVDWKAIIQGVVDAVVAVIKFLIMIAVDMAEGVIIAFKEISGYALIWKAGLVEMFGKVGIELDYVKGLFKLFGQIVKDVFTLNWGSIASDWQAGLKQLGDGVTREAQRLADSVGKIRAAGQRQIAQGEGMNRDLVAQNARFMQHHRSPGSSNGGHAGEGGGAHSRAGGGSPGGGGGGGSRGAGAGSRPSAGHGDQSSSVVQQWKAALQDQLLAEQNWGVNEAQFTANFWSKKLAATRAGSKDYEAVHRESLQADKALDKQAQQKKIEDIKQTLALETNAAHAEAGTRKAALQQKLDEIDREEKAGRLSAVNAAAQREALNRQLYALDKDLAEKEYQLQRKALAEQLQIEHLAADQIDAIKRQIALLDSQHNAQLVAQNAATDAKIRKDKEATADAIRSKWQGIFQPIVQAWGQSLQGMIQGSQNFRQMLGNIGNAILGEATQWMQKVVLRWITNEATKTAAVVTGTTARTAVEQAGAEQSIMISALSALKQIAHQAAVAAAAAYAAISHIPIVGPVLAPAAAAAALVAVYKLGHSVFSAEGGAGDVPFDNAPFLLHRNEMVLPASIAAPLRTMLVGGAANTNAPFAANEVRGSGGAAAFHYHDHSGRLTPDQIRANKGAFVKMLREAHREFALKPRF